VINITEDKMIIAYTVRVRRPGKGKYDSIYVFGNSPDEFVQNLKDQLKERGYGEMGKSQATKIKNNIEKQLKYYQNLDFSNEGKTMKKTQLKTLIRQVLNEDLPKLNPQELKSAHAHFDPIVKKHGGKIIQYFKSFGNLAVEISSVRVIYNGLVVSHCFSQKDANKLIAVFKTLDAGSLAGEQPDFKTSSDTKFLYWKQE
jgi:hypothetical protein